MAYALTAVGDSTSADCFKMPHRHKPTHETSADHVDRQAMLAHRGDTAVDVRRRIPHLQHIAWDLVCVVESDGRLIGTLSAADLLALPDHADLRD